MLGNKRAKSPCIVPGFFYAINITILSIANRITISVFNKLQKLSPNYAFRKYPILVT